MADRGKYRAFISYSHRDRAWGDWLQKALESYRVPRRLVATQGRDGPVPARLFPIFRDREELPTSADLSAQIHEALGQSDYLIVVCSPHAAQSRWVNEEILAYKRMGREDRILAIIVDGEPNADDKPARAGGGARPSAECFPPALKFRLDAGGALSAERTEHMAADARPQGDGRENAKLKLIAGLLGIDYDALKQRDYAAQRLRFRRLAAISGGTIFLLASLLAMAALFLVISENTRNDAMIAQSRFLARDSQDATATGDARLGMLLALRALPQDISNPSRPVTIEAIAALSQARMDIRERLTIAQRGDATAKAAYSPDGKHIATASNDGVVQLRDAATGQLLWSRSRGRDWFFSITFSKDGRWLVAAAENGGVEIWSVEAGTLLRRLPIAGGAAISADISPDGARIVAGLNDKTVRLWDAKSGALLKTLLGHTGIVVSARFSPDGSRILTASEDGTARIWDPGQDAAIRVFSMSVTNKLTGMMTGAAFSPDGGSVAASSRDNAIRIWKLAGDDPPEILGGEGGEFSALLSVAFSPDGQHVIAGSSTGDVYVWKVDGGILELHLIGHRQDVDNAQFSPDGRGALTASWDGTVRVWDVSRHERALGNLNPYTAGKSVAFAPHDERVLGIVNGSVFDPSSLRIWSPAGPSWAMDKDNAVMSFADFSPDGRYVVSADAAHVLRIWDTVRRTQTNALTLVENPVAAAFLPSASQVVIATDASYLLVWDFAHSTLRRLHRDAPLSEPVDVAVSPDGSRIAVAVRPGQALILDAASGHTIQTLRDASGFVRFAPDGRQLIAASAKSAGEVFGVWDMPGGHLRARLAPGLGWVRAGSYSADGTRLLVVTGGVAQIWDAATDKKLLDVAVPGATSASFSPSGDSVVATGEIATPAIWTLPPRCQRLIDDATRYARTGRFELSASENIRYFVDGERSAWWNWAYLEIRPLFAWLLPAAGERCV